MRNFSRTQKNKDLQAFFKNSFENKFKNMEDFVYFIKNNTYKSVKIESAPREKKIEKNYWSNSLAIKPLSETINRSAYRNLGYHNNQINAATEMCDHMIRVFNGETSQRHLVLHTNYNTQVGKTGALCCFGDMLCAESLNGQKLMDMIGIKKFEFLTGMNDKDLKSQLEDRLFSTRYLTSYIKKKFIKKQSDIKRALKTQTPMVKNIIFIVDESQFGTDDVKNMISQYLKPFGYLKSINELLSENNIFIITVSATPTNELKSDENKTKAYFELLPGDNYYGLDYFLQNSMVNHVDKCFDLNKSILDKINQIDIDCFEGPPLFFVRLSDKKRNFLKNPQYYHEENGGDWDPKVHKIIVVEIDSNSTHGTEISNVYKMVSRAIISRDKRPILFLIKGTLRAGHTLELKEPVEYFDDDNVKRKKKVQLKNLIVYVYEKGSNLDSQIQGLLGRYMGYRFVSEFEQSLGIDIHDVMRRTSIYVDMEHLPDRLDSITKKTSGLANTRGGIYVYSDKMHLNSEGKALLGFRNKHEHIVFSKKLIPKHIKAINELKLKGVEFTNSIFSLIKENYEEEYNLIIDKTPEHSTNGRTDRSFIEFKVNEKLERYSTGPGPYVDFIEKDRGKYFTVVKLIGEELIITQSPIDYMVKELVKKETKGKKVETKITK